jgi:cytochrome P450
MLDFLGGAILVSDFESWEYQRHMVMINLGSRAFRSFAMSTITRKAGTTLLPYLDYMAKLGSEVELEGVFMRFFLDVTYSTAFATDLDSLSMSRPIHAFGQATKEVEEGVLFRHMMPPWLWKFLRVLNVGSEKKMVNARVVIDGFIFKEIAKRNTEGNKENQGDVLSLLMKWPMDPSMSEQQMTLFRRDTVMAFIFAAKDLVAVTLTWFFYMMCKHPHVEARILEEVKALQSTTLPGNLSVFEGDMLRRAIYLQAALLETLR